MTIKQLLFSLSLVAVLGACSKSPNEPVLPSTQSEEPRIGLSLSGEIEFPDLDPDLPIGGGTAKDLTLTRFTRKSDGKRFVTPFFSDTKLPAIFCIYDGYGNSYFFRAAIEVSTTLSSNGQYVNKFHFNDKEIVGKNGKGLPDTRFKFIEKTKVTGRKQSSGVISYGEPGDENVYVAIFLGFDPKSDNPDDYSDHLLPENQRYTHGGWETSIGQNIDYTKANANTNVSQTRIIFGTAPGKHKLTLDTEKGSRLGTPTGRHILSSSNLKLQMRGVLLECEIENKSGYDVILTSMRVNNWGGHSIVLREATSKSVKKGGTTVDEVDVLPDIEPNRFVYRSAGMVYEWDRNTGTLDVNGLKIENFKNGDLGIHLQEKKTGQYSSGVRDSNSIRVHSATGIESTKILHQPKSNIAHAPVPGNWDNMQSVKPLKLEAIPQHAQNIYQQSKQIFTEFCNKKDISYDERSLDNIAMALAAEGYANKMREASLINIKENGQILIGDKAPELRTASVDMQKAAVTPIEESLIKVQVTAQQFELETQQKQLAQVQAQGI